MKSVEVSYLKSTFVIEETHDLCQMPLLIEQAEAKAGADEDLRLPSHSSKTFKTLKET